MGRHDRLDSGSFRFHENGDKVCDDCFRPRALKLFLDDEFITRGIARTWFCKDNPVDFSIGVMTFSSVRKCFVDVMRACSAHANYHVHWWHHLKVNEKSVQEHYPLNTQDDVIAAHQDASANVFPRYTEWKAKWSRRI